VRLKASEIEYGVKVYGKTLVLPPPDAYSQVDVIPVRLSARTPQAYSIRFRLYTEEEGHSDLEVQATFVEESSSDFMTVELDDILVA
jgi:hypothetical protein